MHKIKNEALLVKEAVRVGSIYVEKRGIGKFEKTDAADVKMEFIYKALVHDKLIQPLAKDQVNKPNMRHKLALWISRQLPEDHELLK